ncbi:unnamed protein product [Calypogeia fissa]
MASSSSSNGGHSVGGLSILMSRLREKKTSWDAERVPKPHSVDDPQFHFLVQDFKDASDTTEINLVGWDLGDTVISALGRAMVEASFPALKFLHLGGNFITEVGIRDVAKAIQIGHLPALESLNLFPERPAHHRQRFLKREESNWVLNQIEDGGMKMLADAFASGNASVLKVLTLEQNGFSTDGAKHLANEIRNGRLPALEVLNLSYNDVGDEGVKMIAKAFVSGSNLKVLDLETCNIFADGTKALATAFMSGNVPGLTELYLGNNDMGRKGHREGSLTPNDQGLEELARVLKNGQLPQLQILDLDHNVGGSRKAAEAFRDAVRSNRSLVLRLKINWPSFSNYESNVRKNLDRNRRVARLLEQLRGEVDVPATNGKIFLCGHPREGKTTLRRSLQKRVTMFSRETNFRDEPRTRGIEVSHIVSKGEGGGEPIKLAIWDLAGQWEYQVLHSAFLPDLAFADGQATTFVVVCNAKYPSADTGGERQGRQMLNYWMRFIASSAIKGEEKGKRYVIVVLNRFNGEPCKYLDQWNKYLRDLRRHFHEYLEIEDTPFVVDARVARSVSQLKEHLIQHTRKKLETKKVPRICQYLQDTIREDVKTRDFPVVSWAVFAAKFQSTVPNEDTLKAAVEYLHESGHLIHFFREGAEDTVHEAFGQGRSLVVLDPDWFCRRVVGYLLLPDNATMLDDGEDPLTRRVDTDGSIALRDLKLYFRHTLHDSQQVKDIVAILLRLGICYMAGPERVLIPALINDQGNYYPTGSWSLSEMQEAGDQWVMGYCLKVQYKTTTLLPIAVFRRLQVALAQDEMWDYKAGKFNITFGTNAMAVLVEFSAHEQDPSLEDRVDILVRPLARKEFDTSNEKRRLQVELAHLILEKFVSLAETWSPGVEFVRSVMKPWCTAKGTLPMEQRIVTVSVEDVKSRVQAGQTTTAWAVGGEPVYLIDLLSGNELRGLETLVEEKCAQAERLIVDLGFAQEQQVDSQGQSSESPETETDPLLENIKKVLDVGLEPIHAKLDDLQITMVNVRNDLGKVLNRQRKVLKKLQALERFSRTEVSNSVPRFMYLTKPRDSSGMWMRARDLFVQSATLHFLCEAHYNDNSLHEITDQEGVEIKNLTRVAAKVVPWVIWSLRVAFVAGKVASQALLPGLSQLIQTFPAGGDLSQDSSVSTVVAYWLSAALVTGGEADLFKDSTDTSSVHNSSTPVRPVEVKDGLKEVLTMLLGKELKPMEFQSKFKLKRVVLNDSGYVVWICNDCFSRYLTEGAVEPL